MAAAKNPRNQWSEKAWRDAIRVAVNAPADEKGKKKLQQLATKLVEVGLAGDIPALKEIGDRLDGKVPQALIGGDANDPPVSVRFIELRGVRPK